MTCHCRTQEEHTQRYVVAQSEYSGQPSVEYERKKVADAQRIRELSERTPNPDEFKIVDYEQVGNHLVLKVRYPSCVRCSFDQCKVMVFLSTGMKQALGWTRIDPHFQDTVGETPSPAARFPAHLRGWSDAIAYARSKAQL